MRPISSPPFVAIRTLRRAPFLSLLLAGLAVTVNVPASARSYPELPEAASQEYALDAGDEIRVNVAGLPTMSAGYVVGDDGMITLPLIDGVSARGRSLGELQAAIAKELSDRQILLKPTVSVQLTKGKPFYVLGEVKKPGEYVYRPGMNVLTAIATAGGFTFRARQSKVLVTRSIGGQLVTGTVTSDRRILPGDTINVRESWF